MLCFLINSQILQENSLKNIFAYVIIGIQIMRLFASADDIIKIMLLHTFMCAVHPYETAAKNAFKAGKPLPQKQQIHSFILFSLRG